MSKNSERETRGSSAAGFFALAIILTGAALALQSTNPISIEPASQHAALTTGDVSAPAAGETSAATADGGGLSPSLASVPSDTGIDPNFKSTNTKAPIVPGKDQITILLSAERQSNWYFPTCPEKKPDQTEALKKLAQDIQKSYGGQFGMPGTRCKTDPNDATRKVPSSSTWLPWTLYCTDKSEVGTFGGAIKPGETRDLTDKDIEAIQKDGKNPAITCKMLPPGTQPSKSPEQLKSLATQIANTPPAEQQQLISDAKLNTTDQTLLNQALTEQKTELQTNTEQLTKENQNYDKELTAISKDSSCINDNADVTQACQSKIDTLNAKKMANAEQIASNKLQLDNLAAAKVSLDPYKNLPPGTQPPGTQPPPNGGVLSPQQSAYSRTIGSGLGGPPGMMQPLGNPMMGAQSMAQSPFGGPCTNGYVCMNNTLYYQSTNSMGMYGGSPYGASPYGASPYGPSPYGPSPYGGSPYGGSGQCMTQPMQMCQYGCQMPNGVGQSGSSAQNFIGGAIAGMQLVQAVTSLFGGGGGNNNSMMANPNLSRSCAISPQMQNPYGSGTNGQACPQQPQQPSSSQCTSGTWKPVSSSGNGCVTGYQCVPDGSNGGGASGPPTAQLSCQPQVADTGTPISFSFACGNSNGSTGTGFSTNGALSGNATALTPTPPPGQNIATYTLTCIREGVTSSAQCQVQIGRPGIVLVTNPQKVKGSETTLIGWITSGMKSCAISSPDQADFTLRNANNTSVNGAATSSPITTTTRFQLDCQTIGGGTKSADTTVTIN